MIAWASAQPDLAALHGGRVGTRLHATLPAIRVQRVGGVVPEPWEDNPLIQVECWGASEGPADTLARTFVAALPQFRGVFADGRVWGWGVESMFMSPDDPDLSNHIRYILTLRLLTSP